MSRARARRLAISSCTVCLLVAVILACCPSWNRGATEIEPPFGRAVVDLLEEPERRCSFPLLAVTQAVETAMSTTFQLRRLFLHVALWTEVGTLVRDLTEQETKQAGCVDYWAIVSTGLREWTFQFAVPSTTPAAVSMIGGRVLMHSANHANRPGATTSHGDAGTVPVLVLGYAVDGPFPNSAVCALRRAKSVHIRDIRLGTVRQHLLIRWPRRRFTPLG